MEGFCEDGNELSGSIKCWGVLEQPVKMLLLREDSFLIPNFHKMNSQYNNVLFCLKVFYYVL
jgi:hypothetical protein